MGFKISFQLRKFLFVTNEMFGNYVCLVDLRTREFKSLLVFHRPSFSKGDAQLGVVMEMRSYDREKMFRLTIEQEFKGCDPVQV